MLLESGSNLSTSVISIRRIGIALLVSLAATLVVLEMPALAGNFGSGGNVFDEGQETQVSLQNNDNMSVNFYLPDPPQGFSGALDIVDNFEIMFDASTAGDNYSNGVSNYSAHFEDWYYTIDSSPPRNDFDWQDVLIADGDYGVPNLIGWVDCPEHSATETGSNPNRTCFGSVLRLDYDDPDWYISNGRFRVALCHELGHTVGLQHPSGAGEDEAESCMQTEPVSTWRRWLSEHDHGHLGDEYD